ncbi:MAG: YpdA family putative bacillithiol disulfide reductase [Cyclobacteriaceae bacterium]|nr:YpdA family putative bacillithiol disulfide reductase [Cyclobacteriaceae bacterium]MCH8516448.1 YpdA family putative bacillithiol disulfide reductase [Cyclobacteriaceae bacterium]
MNNEVLDVVIIGAGPCGLAAAIDAQKANLKYTILEKGNIVESIRRYPVNMKFFSTSEMIEIGGMPFVSQEIRPSRIEALKYYQKVTERFNLSISRYTEVKEIKGEDGDFEIITSKGRFYSKKVIIAIGYYDIPRKLGVAGEDLPHVSNYYTEAYAYHGMKVVVVGGANSAIETALDLYRNGVEVTLVHQYASLDKTAKYWIVPDLENRINKGEVSAYFEHRVSEIKDGSVVLSSLKGGESKEIAADQVFLMVGYHPDEQFLKKVGIQLNGEMMIPEAKPDTYESNIKGIYLAGSVLGGEETSKIFIENGKEHGKSIIQDVVSNQA